MSSTLCLPYIQWLPIGTLSSPGKERTNAKRICSRIWINVWLRKRFICSFDDSIFMAFRHVLIRSCMHSYGNSLYFFNSISRTIIFQPKHELGNLWFILEVGQVTSFRAILDGTLELVLSMWSWVAISEPAWELAMVGFGSQHKLGPLTLRWSGFHLKGHIC